MTVIAEGFLNGAAYNVSGYMAGDYQGYPINSEESPNYESMLKNFQFQNVSRIQTLSNSACIAAYGGSFVTNRGSVLAVSPNPDPPGNNSVLAIFFPPTIKLGDTGGSWVCGSSPLDFGPNCDVSAIEANASHWKVEGYPIAYCLSQQVEEICRFEFSMQLLVAVILCNLIKAICMAFTIWQQKVPTLVTIGDAISSFLDSPDPTTIKNCMMSRADVVRRKWGQKKRFPGDQTKTQGPLIKPWCRKQKRWFSSASAKRWMVCISL